jgi:hypothetical protein
LFEFEILCTRRMYSDVNSLARSIYKGVTNDAN